MLYKHSKKVFIMRFSSTKHQTLAVNISGLTLMGTEAFICQD